MNAPIAVDWQRMASTKKKAPQNTELPDPFEPGESALYDLGVAVDTWQRKAKETGAPDDVAVATALAAVEHLAWGNSALQETDRQKSLRLLHRIARKLCDFVPTELEHSKGADLFAEHLLKSIEASSAELAWLTWMTVDRFFPGLRLELDRESAEKSLSAAFEKLKRKSLDSKEWSEAAVKAALRALGYPDPDNAFKHRWRKSKR